MAQSRRETLLDWLRDAHAAEHMAIDTLEQQAKRLEGYPQMQTRVREHLEESRQQAQRVEQCIRQLGGNPSVLKKGMSKLMGNMAALTSAGAEDETVKSALTDYAFEHFEIASYRSLIAAAEACNEPEIKATCEDILRQEEAMADWLEQHLPEVTQAYLTAHVY